MNWWLLVLPFISAFICWWIAGLMISSIFQPIAGIRNKSLILKYRAELSDRFAVIISSQISFDDISQNLVKPDGLERIKPLIDEQVENFLRNKLGQKMPMINMFIGDKTIKQLKEIFMEELVELFPVIMNEYIEDIKKETDLKQLINLKLSAVSDEKIGALSRGLFLPLRKKIALTGCITGFIIGLIQLILTLLLTNI